MKNKIILFGIFTILFFSCHTEKKITPPVYDDYSKSSGITSIKLDDQKTKDLSLLGKVWGFLKYYHPEVAKGTYKWDYELFKILPKIISSKNSNERNSMLTSWIESLGPIGEDTVYKIDSAGVKSYPDLAWINETGILGDTLSKKLVDIKNAKRSRDNYYVTLTNGAGNPVFTHEDSCVQMKYPDAGYRLLCLFRYWNCVQYFYPDKHLIGEDWKNVLTEFIPKFINDSNELDYKLTASELLANIHDSHAAFICMDTTWINYFGKFNAPVKICFIENKAVVVDFFDDSLGKKSGLAIGDIITNVGGQTTDDFVKEKMPLVHASNLPTALRNLSRVLLASKDSILNITYQRGSESRNLNLKCYSEKIGTVIAKKYMLKDTCLKYITNDIGYIFPGTMKNEYFSSVMKNNLLGADKGFLNTKGIIIDFRCYPFEPILENLSAYLLPAGTNYVKCSNGNIINPGLFNYTYRGYVGTKKEGYYNGKLVIIVNEQTQSQAEWIVMALRCAPHATVIGSTTAGADGNVSSITLIGGIRTYISGIGVYYPDGKETQRVGIIPDIEVHPTIEGIRNGRDELLEKAIEIINGR